MASIRNVSVIGGGLMGAGIAEVCVTHGFAVTVVELNAEQVDKSRTNVERHLRQYATRTYGEDRDAGEQFWRTAIARLVYTTSLPEGVRSADLVVEAIVEDLRAKHELFVALDKVCVFVFLSIYCKSTVNCVCPRLRFVRQLQLAPAHCLLVSNTSSLSVNDIGRVLSALRRRLFAGLHFFAPVGVTRVVEIIDCADTTAETHGLLEHFVLAIAKQSLTCKDTPGFVVNGLLIPLVAGAVRMVETGVASAADVDKAMRLALFHPVGPLQLADLVGLDVCKNITDGFALGQPENPLYRGRLLNAMVARGELGIKSGKGFYEYTRAKL